MSRETPPPALFPGVNGEPLRYLVFSGAEYFALGGWRDLQAGFATLDTAMSAAGELPEEQWVQVIDLTTMQPVFERGEAYGVTIDNPFVTAAA